MTLARMAPPLNRLQTCQTALALYPMQNDSTYYQDETNSHGITHVQYKECAVEMIIIALERTGRVILASNRCGSRCAQFTSICDRVIQSRTLVHTRATLNFYRKQRWAQTRSIVLVITVFTLHFSEITLRDSANLRGDTSDVGRTKGRAWKVQKVENGTKNAGSEPRMPSQYRETEADVYLARWECLRFEEFDFRACVYIASPSTHRYKIQTRRSSKYVRLKLGGPLGATNASKHSIDQSEDRILQINQKMLRSIRSAK